MGTLGVVQEASLINGFEQMPGGSEGLGRDRYGKILASGGTVRSLEPARLWGGSSGPWVSEQGLWLHIWREIGSPGGWGGGFQKDPMPTVCRTDCREASSGKRGMPLGGGQGN